MQTCPTRGKLRNRPKIDPKAGHTRSIFWMEFFGDA